MKRTGSSCWTTVQIVTDVVRESISAGPTCACVCYVFTVFRRRFLSSVRLSHRFITRLHCQLRGHQIYFYTATIIPAFPIPSLPTLPQISPTSIQSPIPLTPAHLPLPTPTPPPSVCPRSEEIKCTYGNTLFRVITRFLSTRVLQVLRTRRSHTHIFRPHNMLLDPFQW